jgi:hypothetical protein
MVVPKKNNSNVISMADLTHKSVLTFSRGLELRHQIGLEIRVLGFQRVSQERTSKSVFVLSKLLAGGNFSSHPAGYLG